MKNNLGELMKQAQQMQSNIQKAQQELASLRVTGTSGAGLVKIVMTGRYDVESVVLDESIVTSDDIPMLQDLIAAAINDATRKVESTSKEKMSSLMSGLDLPPGFNLPTG